MKGKGRGWSRIGCGEGRETEGREDGGRGG